MKAEIDVNTSYGANDLTTALKKNLSSVFGNFSSSPVLMTRANYHSARIFAVARKHKNRVKSSSGFVLAATPGEMAEWSKAPDLGSGPHCGRGFKPHSRHFPKDCPPHLAKMKCVGRGMRSIHAGQSVKVSVVTRMALNWAMWQVGRCKFGRCKLGDVV